MNIPSLRPGDIALVTGDYRQGKSTFVKAWAMSLGRGAFWAAPVTPGGQVEFSDVAVVVRSAREMELAAKKAAFVVWPAPPLSAGQEERLAQFNEFCRVALTFKEAVIVCDEIQNLLDSKFLKDAPPAFRDLVETGHKKPRSLAKVFCAHRLAQIPLNLGGGAYRVAFRPYPGDEAALQPFYGKQGLQALRRFGVGEFGFWSQAAGAVYPCKLNLGHSGPGGPSRPGEKLGQ